MFNLARLRGFTFSQTPINFTPNTSGSEPAEVAPRRPSTPSRGTPATPATPSDQVTDATFTPSESNPVSDDLNRFQQLARSGGSFRGVNPAPPRNPVIANPQNVGNFTPPDLSPRSPVQLQTPQRDRDSQPSPGPATLAPNVENVDQIPGFTAILARFPVDGEERATIFRTPTQERFEGSRADDTQVTERSGNGSGEEIRIGQNGRGGSDTLTAIVSDAERASIGQRGESSGNGFVPTGVANRRAADGDDTLIARSDATVSTSVAQSGNFGDDTLISLTGDGDDRVRQNGGDDNDRLQAISGAGNDSLELEGHLGDDILEADGGLGDDRVRLDGGEGNDTLNYIVSAGLDDVRLTGGEGEDRATIGYSEGDSFIIRGPGGEILQQVGEGGTEIFLDVEEYRLVNLDETEQGG